MQCPVCPFSEIPPDAPQCPNCGTELGPLRRVQELCGAQYNDALRLGEAGAADAAALRLAGCLALDEQFVPARRLLGKILWQQGRRDEAVFHWRRGLAVAPQDEELKALAAQADREVARRRARRGFAGAAAVAGTLAVLAAAAYLPWRAASRALDELRPRPAAPGAASTGAPQTGEGVAAELQAVGNELRTLAATVEQLREASAGRTRLEGLESSVAETVAATATLRTLTTSQAAELGAGQRRIAAALTAIESRVEAGEFAAARQGTDLERALAQATQRQAESLAAWLATVREDSAGQQAELLSRLAATRQEVAALSARLSDVAIRSEETSRAAADTLAALARRVDEAEARAGARDERLRSSLYRLAEVLRPQEAGRLARELEASRTRLAALRAQAAEYEGRQGYPLDGFRLSAVRQEIAEEEPRLAGLEAEHRRVMGPWESAVADLSRSLGLAGGGDPTGKARQ